MIRNRKSISRATFLTAAVSLLGNSILIAMSEFQGELRVQDWLKYANEMLRGFLYLELGPEQTVPAFLNAGKLIHFALVECCDFDRGRGKFSDTLSDFENCMSIELFLVSRAFRTRESGGSSE
jgi:hypothetical protein